MDRRREPSFTVIPALRRDLRRAVFGLARCKPQAWVPGYLLRKFRDDKGRCDWGVDAFER
jgi:hypothetical protein